MSWTKPKDLRAQLEKLWERGEILSSLVTGEPLFPRRLTLKCPTSTEMVDRFDEVRTWVGEIYTVQYCRVETREFKHRIFGTNSIPAEVWIDSLDDAAAFIAKRKDIARFVALVDETKQSQPDLLEWLKKRPLRALALADEWTRLLAIVDWIQANPRPNIYLRQVDIPGVHTKFIEANRGVLAELFDIVLPQEGVDLTASGVGRFAERYGFRDKPLRIRFRLLDTQAVPAAIGQDIALDAPSFASLNPKISRVFITENEINFLAFPLIKDSLVIFGAGYGFEMLRQAQWLSRCQIYYWGDIDTHGFAILDQLRNQFSHTESFLMDKATLLKFEPLWDVEEQQTLRDLPRLTLDELALYNELRDNRIRKNLRLEQERIGFTWFETALKRHLDYQ